MCKGSVLWKSKVDSVLGHEVVRLQRCTSDVNHLMWARKFKTLVVLFSQHLTMICPDSGQCYVIEGTVPLTMSPNGDVKMGNF